MGKPTGGGGGTAFFDLSVSGPPPGPLTVASEAWCDMGAIPAGKKVWLGNASYTSPDKSITFEIRGNTSGNSTGTVANTTLLATKSVSARNGTVLVDFYKNGSLHIATILGTGTEKWWLRLVSKGAAGSFLYNIRYTLE